MEADKQRIDRELVEAVQAKDSTHEQLLALQDQLANGLSGKEQLTEQLGALRAELEQVSQEGESERLELSASLERAVLAYQELECSLSEQEQESNIVVSERIEQSEMLEKALCQLKVDHQDIERQLVGVSNAKSSVDAKLLEMESQLASGSDDYEQLLTKLKQAETELSAINSVKEKLQEELKQGVVINAAEPAKDYSVELGAVKERCKELSESFDKLSAERLSDDRLFKRQLIEWDGKLQKAEEDKLVLEGLIEEHKAQELLTLDSDGKVDECLRDEIVELEATVAAALKDQSFLESQLEEATGRLVDFEVKQQLSAVDEADVPRAESASKLEALQSELSLVREQTEKDVLVMQEKLGHSEKMNMALKKKILSMQGTSKVEEPASGEPKEKAKSWWQT